MTIQVKIYEKHPLQNKRETDKTTTNSKALIFVPTQSQTRYDCPANSLGFCLRNYILDLFCLADSI